MRGKGFLEPPAPPALEPCWWCSGKAGVISPVPGCFFASCIGCGATSPPAAAEREAIEVHNNGPGQVSPVSCPSCGWAYHSCHCRPGELLDEFLARCAAGEV